MPDRRLRGCWTRPRPTGRAPVARTVAIGRREPRAVPVADLARGVGRDVRGLGLRLESSTVGEPCSDVTCNTGSEQPPPIAGGSWTRTECHAHAPTAGVRYRHLGARRPARYSLPESATLAGRVGPIARLEWAFGFVVSRSSGGGVLGSVRSGSGSVSRHRVRARAPSRR